MAKKKGTVLSGVCCASCFYAKGDVCKCRCNKAYHGLGRKNSEDLSDHEKDLLAKLPRDPQSTIIPFQKKTSNIINFPKRPKRILHIKLNTKDEERIATLKSFLSYKDR